MKSIKWILLNGAMMALMVAWLFYGNTMAHNVFVFAFWILFGCAVLGMVAIIFEPLETESDKSESAKTL